MFRDDRNVSQTPDEDYSLASGWLIALAGSDRYRLIAGYTASTEDTTMGNQAPGSEQQRRDQNNQGTSSPGSKDPSRKGQMEQQGGRQNQTGGSQQRHEDKEKDRSK